MLALGRVAVLLEQLVVVSPAPETTFLMLWPSVLAKKIPPPARMTVFLLTFQAAPSLGGNASSSFRYATSYPTEYEALQLDVGAGWKVTRGWLTATGARRLFPN